MKKFQLRDDLSIIEQTYRGEQSFIVKETVTHKYYRFKFLEVLVMQQLDGEHTCPEVAAALAEQGLPFKAAAVESFARKLDGMGLLAKTVQERSVLQMERLRAERNRRVKKTHYQGSLLRMRWSVGDPDEFFNRWTPRMGFFFSKPFLAMSVVLFVTYFAVIIGKHQQFVESLKAMYHPSNWSVGFFVLFWVTGVTVIAIHEFGHGFTCKHFGGEVHEMGAMLIYLQPAFYCNVNDAWTFPELRARMWVTAAGTWIQMVIAGLAAIVWWAVEPDTVLSQVALIAVLIGGATTVFANANPLIPLDGYYALSDWLEIPNLRQRAFGYIGYLLKRHVLRLSTPEFQADEREKRIFLVYGLLAVCYSATLLFLLVSRLYRWVALTFGALGAIAFLFLVWSGLKRRMRAGVQAMMTSAREHRGLWRSARMLRRVGIIAGAAVLLGLVIPWPIKVAGRFRAATSADIALTAPLDAVIARVLVQEGATVSAGATIAVLRAPERERDAITLAWLADSLAALSRRALAQGRSAQAQQLEATRDQAASAAAALRDQLDQLVLRAPMGGMVVTPRLEEQLGRKVARGDTVVQLVASGDSVELRVALERAGATLVRAGQPASIVPLTDVGAARRTTVTSVAASAAGLARSDGHVEARIRVPASWAWRPGVTGEVYITVRRSSVLGALWWGVRKRVRNDLLL